MVTAGTNESFSSTFGARPVSSLGYLRLGPRRVAAQLVVFLLLMLSWQAASRGYPVFRTLVGSPSSIGARLVTEARSGAILGDIAITALEAFLGFLIGTLIGSLAGLFAWFSLSVRSLVAPWMLILGAVPVFVFGPLLVLWFGTGMAAKVALASLASFLISYAYASSGAASANEELERVIGVLTGSRKAVFRHVVAPASFLWVLSGARANIGVALSAAFVAEFLNSNRGIGHAIIVAEGLFDVEMVWVGVGAIVLLAVCLSVALRPVEIWARRWR